MSDVVLIVNDNIDSVDCTYTDAVVPSSHAVTHRISGSDPLALTDIINLPGDALLYLNGTGGFSTPAGGDGSAPTNLSTSYSSTGVTINSDTGTDAIINSATTSLAGILSASDKTKLDGIQAGAEININADWNSTSGDSFILNKPLLGSAALSNTGDFAPNTHASRHVTGGSDKIRDASASQDGLMTAAYASKLDGIANNANNYILPVATIATIGGVKRNVGASGEFIQSIDSFGNLVYAVPPIGSGGAGPTNLSVSYSTTGIIINSDTGSDASINPATTSLAGMFSANDKTKLDSIQSGAEVNVNADWSSVGGDSLILNKPTLGSAAALNTGNSINTVAVGNDPRFTDARTPLSHSSTHISSGSDPIRLATPSQDGLMSPSYASKLEGIAVNANNYVLPVATLTVIGGVKRNTGASGEFIQSIDSFGNLVYATPSGSSGSSTPSNLSISYSTTGVIVSNTNGSGFSINVSTSGAAGLMSSTDRLKLDSIESGAQQNVNADWSATTGSSVILNKPNISLSIVGIFLN